MTTIPDIESVQELAPGSWDAESIYDLAAACADTDEDTDPDYYRKMGLAFPLAAGLYWYCVHHHGGQWSPLYALMCRVTSELCFKPARSSTDGPHEEDDRYVYRDLLGGELEDEDEDEDEDEEE